MFGTRNPHPDYAKALARRDFLKLAAFGAAGSSMSGWLEPLASAAAQDGKHKSCIVLWLAGGLSQLESFDLKEYSFFKPIDTSVPGIQVSDHLPKLAKLMQHAAVIRSMCTLEAEHSRAAYHMHTGGRPIAGGTVLPSIGSIASMELGKPDYPLPNYVVIGAPLANGGSRVGDGAHAGFLGARHEPLLIKKPTRGVENLAPVANDLKLFDQRAGLLNQVEQGFYKNYQAPTAEAHRITLQRASQMMHSKEAKAYDLSLEPASVREAYGKNGYGDGCVLARRLVEVRVPFVEVSMPEWDNHSGCGYHKQNMPAFDTALSALITDLKDRGLLDSTLIVVMSEFGRGGTNHVGPDAKSAENRNHWHKAWSTALIGGGIKGGQVIGRTDKKAAIVEDRPVTPADFFATICKVLGIDYTKENNDGRGRPMRIVDKGEKPILEVL